MGRKKSDIVSAAGTAFEIVQKLSGAVADLGGSDEDLRRLLSDKKGLLSEVAALLVKAGKRQAVVDLDADPFVPEGWTVEEHRKGGSLDLATAKIGLHLADGQKNGSVRGEELRRSLADKSVLNANALDFLLANTHLIPEEWKTKPVFFWGTVYHDRGGRLHVRFLDWDGGGWVWRYDWLGIAWSASSPAAVVASSS